MKLHATGHLAHHFHLDYWAGVGLAFESAEGCALALPELAPADLGVDWRICDQDKRVALIQVDSEQLKKLVAHLVTLGADERAIDSVAHSIDYGDPFTVTVEVEDPKQVLMFA